MSLTTFYDRVDFYGGLQLILGSATVALEGDSLTMTNSYGRQVLKLAQTGAVTFGTAPKMTNPINQTVQFGYDDSYGEGKIDASVIYPIDRSIVNITGYTKETPTASTATTAFYGLAVQLAQPSDHVLGASTLVGEILTVDGKGGIGLAIQMLKANSTALNILGGGTSTKAIEIAGTYTFGLYQASTTTKHYLEGKVGLGTDNPSEALVVDGNVIIQGTCTVNNLPVPSIPVQASGSPLTVRGELNYISGEGVTLTLVDDATNSVTKITSTIELTDNTANDVSTSKHGFVPKAPNDTTKWLRGDGTWAYMGIKSLQKGVIQIPGEASSATATISSCTVAKSFVLYEGHYESTSNRYNVRIELTDATTLTTRLGLNLGVGESVYVGYTVVEFY